MSRTPASSALAMTDPATTPEQRTRTVQPSVTEEPMTVASRGRLYTTEDIRRRLGCNDENAGRGIEVAVKIDNVDRRDEWIHVKTAVFSATLATDGVIRIPVAVRDELSLSAGDSVRVSIRVTNT